MLLTILLLLQMLLYLLVPLVLYNITHSGQQRYHLCLYHHHTPAYYPNVYRPLMTASSIYCIALHLYNFSLYCRTAAAASWSVGKKLSVGNQNRKARPSFSCCLQRIFLLRCCCCCCCFLCCCYCCCCCCSCCRCCLNSFCLKKCCWHDGFIEKLYKSSNFWAAP